MKKGFLKCVGLLICSVFLLLCCAFPSVCLDYSEDSPSYVPEKGNFYIQVSTTELGSCTFLLPNNYKADILSTRGNTLQLYNTTMSTINGYVLTSSGVYYRLRFNALDTAEYYTSTSYGTWNDLTVSQLLTSNGSILGSNGQKVYLLSDFEKIIISCVIVLLTLIFGCNIVIMFKRRG